MARAEEAQATDRAPRTGSVMTAVTTTLLDRNKSLGEAHPGLYEVVFALEG